MKISKPAASSIPGGARIILRRRPHRLGQHAHPAHLAIARRVRLRPLHLSPAAHLQLQLRRLGPHPDTKTSSSRDGTATIRFFDPATFREVRHIDSQRPRPACGPAQRARIHPRPDLRQRLAHRPHRAHLARHWSGSRLDQSRRPARRRANAPTPKPSSTASLTTPRTIASSSPANSGPSSSRSRSSPPKPKWFPSTTRNKVSLQIQHEMGAPRSLALGDL